MLPLGLYVHGSDVGFLDENENNRPMMVELMRQKIAMASSVHVINTDGEIGNGTKMAIVFAIMSGKPVSLMCDLPKHSEVLEDILVELRTIVVDNYGALKIDTDTFHAKYGFNLSAIPIASLRRGCRSLKFTYGAS